MEPISITRWPCLVITSQRTGSTALSTMLAKYYNVDCFIEPAEQNHKLEQFEAIHKNFDHKYLVKFMTDRIGNYRIYRNLVNEVQPYKIGLYRKNTLAQVVSMYIASQTGVWYGNQVPGIEQPEEKLMHIPIKTKAIDRHIKIITKNNILLRAYKVHYDRILSYESLPLGRSYRQSTKPYNHADVVAAVTERFEVLDRPTEFNLEQ